MTQLRKYYQTISTSHITPRMMFLGIVLLLIVPAVFFVRNNAQTTDFEKCRKDITQNRFNCYEKVVTALTRQKGPAIAIMEIEDMQRRKAFLKPTDCHILLHFVGYETYQKYRDVQKSRAAVGPIGRKLCVGGFEHAILSKHFNELKNKLPVINLMKTSCLEYWDLDIPDQLGNSCFHAIGHALVFSQNNLLTPLTYCTKLPFSWQEEYCGTGVFMEYMFSNSQLLSRHATTMALAKNIQDVCMALDKRWKKICYGFIGITSISQGTFKTFAEAFRQCEDIEDQYRAACYANMGTGILIGGVARSLADIETQCRAAIPEKHIPTCMIHSAEVFFQYNPNYEISPETFCVSFKNQETTSLCREMLYLTKNLMPVLHNHF